MKTIGSELARQRGVGPGFDYLRIALAVAIVAWHTEAILAPPPQLDQQQYVWMLGYAPLVAFFGLSGFLIAGSATRLSLVDFLINRGLRILPALGVEVVFCALVLGPLFTSLSPAAYFSSAQTWSYFTNIAGAIHFHLPGVFNQHPNDIVNKSLWTVPHELGCYYVMSMMIYFGVVQQWRLVAAVFVALLGAGFLFTAAVPDAPSGMLSKIAWQVLAGPPSRLYPSFILGIAFYLLRDRLPYSHAIAALCVAWLAGISCLTPAPWLTAPIVNALAVFPILYLTIYVGVSQLPELPLLKHGDYSYGIYLYGWPIQQMVFAVERPAPHPGVHFLTSLPFIVIFAAFSWHAIEKPIMRLRKRFSFIANVRLEAGELTGAKVAPALE
jgi:peptidoglycan/LPS O-acetylase OafA/YrhL